MGETLLQWYAGRLWQAATLVDALVLRPPLSRPDHPEDFARELLHRLAIHRLSVRLWRIEWLVLAALALLCVWVFASSGFWTLSDGIFVGVILSAAALAFAPLFMSQLALRRNAVHAEFEAAVAVVERVCLRQLPPDTPEDLADPWRHGWLTADLRPVAAEIAEIDLRRIEAIERARSLIRVALCVGLIPLAATSFGFFALLFLTIFVIRKARRDPNPAAMRARLLDVGAASTAEGAAWANAGGTLWAQRIEDARTAQIHEAIRDTTPLIDLGESLGIMAARGDFFAPSAGLPMRLSLRDLMQHLLVLGGTGSGKTAGVLRPICRQIGELSGVGLIVLDGKGALPGEVARFVPDLVVIEPSGKAMSLVEGLTPTEIVSTISDILGGAEGRDRFFEESAAGLMRFAAVLAKLEGGATWSLTGIYRLASSGPDEELLENADLTVPEVREAVSFFKDDWPKVEAEVKSSIIATLRSWYTTITGHPDTLRWASTTEGGSDVDITLPLRGGRIGILAPAHRYGQAGPVVVALLKARIFAAVRDRADRGMAEGETSVVLVMDEAQEVATKQDALVLSIARSLSLAIVAATQTVEGIEARLGEKDAAQYLTLFGSVLALQNRSPKTADTVAQRIGASFRAVLEGVPGAPTVRGAVMAQRAAGRLAAARHQPLVAATIQMGEGGSPRDLMGSINPFQLLTRTLKGEQGTPMSRLGVAPLVFGSELSELVVEPDTAFAVITRGRVPRRDVIRLNPLHEVFAANKVTANTIHLDRE